MLWIEQVQVHYFGWHQIGWVWKGRDFLQVMELRLCMGSFTVRGIMPVYKGQTEQFSQQKWEIGATTLKDDWRNVIRPNEERAFWFIGVRIYLLNIYSERGMWGNICLWKSVMCYQSQQTMKTYFAECYQLVVNWRDVKRRQFVHVLTMRANNWATRLLRWCVTETHFKPLTSNKRKT